MKTLSAVSFVAAAIVSGCITSPTQPSSTRRTLFDSPTSSSSQSIKPATVRTAGKTAKTGSFQGETPIRPVRIDERPVALDDVGPAGRVHPKPSVQAPRPVSSASTPQFKPPRTAPLAPARPVSHGSSSSPTTGGAYRIHTVQPGETALGIAIANSMSLDELRALNPEIQNNPDRIRVGQGLKVAGPPSAPRNTVVARNDSGSGKQKVAPPLVDRTSVQPQPTQPAQSSKHGQYVIQEGDTLSAIAHKEGGSVADWKAANGLSDADTMKLHPGQRLVRPVPSAGKSNPSAGKVQPADSSRSHDVEAPPPPPEQVKVAGTDASIDDVFAGGLSGAKEKARAQREEAEKLAREKAAEEKARLEAAQKAAEEARVAAENAKRQAEAEALKAAKGAEKAVTETVQAVSATAKPGEYIVQPGDDIFSIALKFDVMPLALRKANGSDLADLKPGQVLKIPPKD